MMENIERDKKIKDKEEEEEKKRDKLDPVIASLGKRLSECNSDEIAGQFSPGRW